jgi:hypothetical protein
MLDTLLIDRALADGSLCCDSDIAISVSYAGFFQSLFVQGLVMSYFTF